MKKIKLNPDDLVVETFDTVLPSTSAQGTVVAHDVTQAGQYCSIAETCANMGTCNHTCGISCMNSCEFSCAVTCGPTNCGTGCEFETNYTCHETNCVSDLGCGTDNLNATCCVTCDPKYYPGDCGTLWTDGDCSGQPHTLHWGCEP